MHKSQVYKILGFSLLIISTILWLLIAVVPFLSFSPKVLAATLTVLVIAGEITFYASVFFLGKEYIKKYKEPVLAFFRKFWNKKNSNNA